MQKYIFGTLPPFWKLSRCIGRMMQAVACIIKSVLDGLNPLAWMKSLS